MSRPKKEELVVTDNKNEFDITVTNNGIFSDEVAPKELMDEPIPEKDEIKENKENSEILNTLSSTTPEPTLKQKEEWVFNPNGKTNVRNITNIGISVVLENTVGRRGEVFIPAKQARPINNEEIIIKVEAQNPSFCGTDGLGTNASLYIEDKGFREYLDFEGSNIKQVILTDNVLLQIFQIEKLSEFKTTIEDCIKTYAEKDKLMSYLRDKHNVGDFDSASKIDFVEQYTGLKIKQ